jgi:hypothetical protein
VIVGGIEVFRRPTRERREIESAKARARLHWQGKGYSAAEIDAWDTNPKSDWWWIGRSR